MTPRVWVAWAAAGVAMAAGTTPSSNTVTFTRDVLPILQRSCQGCHRPRQIAPMSLLSYQKARPWAKSIKEAVVTRKMPPWFADAKYGHFSNDPTLKQSEIDTLVKWADNGAPLGNPGDAPRPLEWPANGWQIKPDVIVEGPSFKVPAHPPNNVIEWTTVVVPAGFTEDTWVTSLEIRPADLDVTHHICINFKPHTDDVKYNVPSWTDKKRDESGSELPKAPGQGIGNVNAEKRRAAAANPGETGGCWVPGVGAFDYRTFGAARLIPANTDIVFSLHYTPTGREVTTHTEIGFTLAREEPSRRYVYLATSAPFDAKRFAIPPFDPDWESPPAVATFEEDAELVWMMPHMHVRGKDMTYKLVYPDGREQIILNVPRYDFNWQLGYAVEKPIQVPKGTKLIGTAHFDNSPNNKFNPDPSRTVYYGDMTWEEMMMPFFAVTVDKSVAPGKVLKRAVAPPGGA